MCTPWISSLQYCVKVLSFRFFPILSGFYTFCSTASSLLTSLCLLPHCIPLKIILCFPWWRKTKSTLFWVDTKPIIFTALSATLGSFTPLFSLGQGVSNFLDHCTTRQLDTEQHTPGHQAGWGERSHSQTLSGRQRWHAAECRTAAATMCELPLPPMSSQVGGTCVAAGYDAWQRFIPACPCIPPRAFSSTLRDTCTHVWQPLL